MTSPSEAIAARARALVGVRFRSQGRSESSGLDCVGAAAVAIGLPSEHIRRDYALRGTPLPILAAELERLGLSRVDRGEPKPGDIMVFAPGPEQLHLAVFTGTSFVHADAGLGRVTERPLPAPWPLLGAWRVESPDRRKQIWRP